MPMHRQYSYISYVLCQGAKKEECIQHTCFARAVELWQQAPNTITQVEVYPSTVYLEYFAAISKQFIHGHLIMDLWIKALNTLFQKPLFQREKQKIIYTVPEKTSIIEFKAHLFLLRAMFNWPGLSFIRNLPVSGDPQTIWTRLCFFLCLEHAVGEKNWEGLHDETHCFFRSYYLTGASTPLISFQAVLDKFKKFPDRELQSALYYEASPANVHNFFEAPKPIFLQPNEITRAGNIELFVLPEIEKFRAFLEEAQAVRT